MFQILILSFLSALHLLFAIRTDLFFSQDDFSVLAYFKSYGMLEMVQRFVTVGDMWGFRKILGYLDLRLIYNFFGVNPIAYILNNHLWHTLNVILVYLILLSLTKDKIRSLFVAVIFNATYLMYFSNVHEYLVTTLSLGSIYLYIKNKGNFWSLVLFLLGLMTKELAIFAPMVLLAITINRKESLKSLMPFGVLGVVYGVVQINFALGKMVLPIDHPYATTNDWMTWWHNFQFYVPTGWMVIITGLLILGIQKRSWMFLLAFLLSLFPALILKNRQEMYYWYLPSAYLNLCLGLFLPRLNIRTGVIYLIVLLMLGRKMLPPIAKQDYPNWQKVSILNQVAYVENELQKNPEIKEIKTTNKMERDARLMLGSNVIDLFLSDSISSKYLFEYNQDLNELKVVKR